MGFQIPSNPGIWIANPNQRSLFCEATNERRGYDKEGNCGVAGNNFPTLKGLKMNKNRQNKSLQPGKGSLNIIGRNGRAPIRLSVFFAGASETEKNLRVKRQFFYNCMSKPTTFYLLFIPCFAFVK